MSEDATTHIAPADDAASDARDRPVPLLRERRGGLGCLEVGHGHRGGRGRFEVVGERFDAPLAQRLQLLAPDAQNLTQIIHAIFALAA